MTMTYTGIQRYWHCDRLKKNLKSLSQLTYIYDMRILLGNLLTPQAIHYDDNIFTRRVVACTYSTLYHHKRRK